MLTAFAIVLLPGVARAEIRTFNTASNVVPIPAGAPTVTTGKAGTYPINCFVSDVQNQVVLKATVKLKAVSHTYPDDLDVLLVAPNGTNLVLMSDNGDTNDLNSADLTFDDDAATSLPDTLAFTTGTYKPTNIGAGDTFNFPAPVASAATALSVFNGIDPSGIWSLYVVDDGGGDVGSIAGWQLTLELGSRNTSAITIVDSASPPTKASVYPSNIAVAGLSGTVSAVTVHLNGFTHAFPDDVDMLLVGPGGQKVQLLSDVGGNTAVNDLNLDISDGAAALAPDTTVLTSGAYKPTNYGPGETYPSPAPTGPYGSALADFNGTNPNGVWSLYIIDDATNQAGSLAGWSLSFTQTQPTIQFSSPNYNVSEGVGMATVTVTRSLANGQSKISYQMNSGTASGSTNFPTPPGTDFSFRSGELVFEDGETSKSFTVPIIQDSRDEADETFLLNLQGAINATAGAQDNATVTIIDDDNPPVLSIRGGTVNENGTFLKFPYTLSDISEKPISFLVTTVPGTATAGVDYTSLNAFAVNIPAGSPSLTGIIDVPVIDDSLGEDNETLSLNITGVTNATLQENGAQGVIVNDDASPTVSIADATIAEGDSGNTNLNFTVALSAASALPITVGYSTADATATAGTDYVGASGQLVFNPGTTSQVLSISINGDVQIENDETFNVNLTALGILADGVAVGTIVNDDTIATVPAISVGNATVKEGDSGTANAVFNVALSSAGVQPVTVNYTTANGTASAGTDYAGASGTLTFAPGVTTLPVTVSVIGDTAVEPNETFALNLSGAVNAIVTVASGTGTITNDDAIPAPQMLLYTPTSGLRNTYVTLVGLNLAGITSVKFNGVATTFIINSPTRITAKVPATATTGKITITTAGGTATSSGNYTVIPPPILTGFTPASGPSGTTVTMNGVNFIGVRTVKFNGTISQFTVVSPTRVTAKVPVLATSGKIELTTLAGASTSAGTFKVTPKINVLSPTSGAIGSSVIIDGLSFLGASAVKFNGVAAQYTVLSANRIRATVPANATTGKVTVTTPGGTATSEGNFTVTGSTPNVPLSVSSGLSMASAQAATAVVTLQFTNPLASAGDAANYNVSVNGESVVVESVSVSGTTVSLVLPEGALQSGDHVVVQWRGLRDSSGHALGGTAGMTVR